MIERGDDDGVAVLRAFSAGADLRRYLQENETAARVRIRRATDGWTKAYLDAVTGK